MKHLPYLWQKSHLVISSRWIKVNLHAMLQSLKPFFLQVTGNSDRITSGFSLIKQLAC
jgi:hypothetical protein